MQEHRREIEADCYESFVFGWLGAGEPMVR